jgi:hypothetical protein
VSSRNVAVAGSCIGALTLSAALACGGTAQAASPLFCQSFLGSGSAVVNSQKYPAAASTMTDTGAADFTIPAGGCVISMVNTIGTYVGPSHATTVNVLIKTGATHPAGPNLAPVADHNITTFFSNPGGNFEVTLPATITLAAGHYWLIFQPKMPAGSTWSWSTTSTPNGAPDVWRNPGNGWACGTAWLPITGSCIASPDADFDFQLA